MSRQVVSKRCAYEWKVKFITRQPYSSAYAIKFANRTRRFASRPHRKAIRNNLRSMGSAAGRGSAGNKTGCGELSAFAGTTGELRRKAIVERKTKKWPKIKPDLFACAFLFWV